MCKMASKLKHESKFTEHVHFISQLLRFNHKVLMKCDPVSYFVSRHICSA